MDWGRGDDARFRSDFDTADGFALSTMLKEWREALVLDFLERWLFAVSLATGKWTLVLMKEDWERKAWLGNGRLK